MRIVVIVAWLVLSACAATDPRLTADYYDGYDDGHDSDACMVDNEECLREIVRDV